jgi:uncharacterized protein (DUF1778 family)
MASAANTRTSRIEARIAPEALAAVRRAAEIQGRSVSDFDVAAAQEAAERTIEQTQILRLSLADQERVADLLLNPPKPSAALDRAFAAHRELIRDDQ